MLDADVALLVAEEDVEEPSKREDAADHSTLRANVRCSRLTDLWYDYRSTGSAAVEQPPSAPQRVSITKNDGAGKP
jgi:hypothetical protein